MTEPTAIMNTAIMKLPVGQIAPRALVVGDPNRAKIAADKLDSVQIVSQTREYHTYSGTWKGVPVVVSSHGVGAGGASVCFEELIKAGVQTMIRAGTCGSFRSEFREASLIIATGAVRDDGASSGLIPMSYPAVAHYEVLNALIASVKAHPEVNFGIGLCISNGTFYAGEIDRQYQMWAKAGVLAVEMEVSMLLTIAGMRGVRAGAILNVDGYIFESTAYEPDRDVVHRGTATMLEIALDALVML
jgi:uridine phosphorylase